MRNIEKYYDNTESEKARNNVQYFVDKIKCHPGKAIELGCGAGNDTVYLIKNNWNVLAIDREDVEERIAKRLNDEEREKFRFQKQNFESLELEKNNLIRKKVIVSGSERGFEDSVIKIILKNYGIR